VQAQRGLSDLLARENRIFTVPSTWPRPGCSRYSVGCMRAVEFTIELKGASVVPIPKEVAADDA
jgi:hypothetical protein